MPPSASWYAGRDEIRTFLTNFPMAPAAPHHIHVPIRANRQPAFAVYLADASGVHPIAIEVLRIANGLIAEVDVFMQPGLVERFAVTGPA
jgi:RNA polymerase sigma-70 factor (ECF subfamily)